MKALCWHGTGDVRIDTVPDPKIEHPRDAIIRITISWTPLPYEHWLPTPSLSGHFNSPCFEHAQIELERVWQVRKLQANISAMNDICQIHFISAIGTQLIALSGRCFTT